jgi:phosphoglycerate dehydrogenase-like enzyme
MGTDKAGLKLLAYTQYDPRSLEEIPKRFPGVILTVVTEGDAFLAALPGADILYLHKEVAPEITQKMGPIIASSKKLKWIQWGYTGVDRLRPFETLWEQLLITTSKGMMAEEIADYVILVIQMLYREFPRMMRNQMKRVWERWLFDNPRGKTLGIIGLGAIGSEVARKARFFGMRVIGLDVQPVPQEQVDETFLPAELKVFLGKSDTVAICVPLTQETMGLINEKTVQWMKTGSYLVNVARGKIVDEGALVKAIKSGHLAGAALDVFFPEPLSPESEFWALDNVITTPHLSGAFRDFPEKVLALFCENLERFLEGREMINVLKTKNG